MGLFKYGAQCCNNCRHWQCHAQRKIRGNPPAEIYTDSNCDKCSLINRSTLSKDSCDGFAHLYGASVTFQLPKEKEVNPGEDFLAAVMEFSRETRAINNQAVAANNRRIYIEHGMDPDASEDDQETFAILYGDACKGKAAGYLGLAEGCYLGRFGALVDKEKAVRYYRIAINKGLDGEIIGDAECRLAICYYNGEGVAEDKERGLKWLNRSARHGNEVAKKLLSEIKEKIEKENVQRELERMRAERNRIVDDHVEYSGMDPNASDMAKTLFMGAIGMAEDDVEVQRDLGKWFENGDHGAIKDLSRSLYWYSKAAKQGDSEAEYKVGYMLYFGRGVAEDESEAFQWFERSARQGHAEAQCRYAECFLQGNGVEKDLEKAREWYTKSAEQGEALAQFNLGKIYYFGKGVEKDYGKAAEWFTKAAEAGRTDAQLFLGTCYRRGLGVEKDLDKALELYKKAADDKGEAKFWLGKFYEKGWGSVEKDASKAYEWYLKAAEDGYVDAICAVGWAYQRGDGVEQDYAKAAEWFGKGVDKGDGVCANNLARLYEDGKGVRRDLGKALALFEKASENKCNRAFYHLGRFYENGLGVTIDLTKAKEYYAKAAESGDDDAKAAMERFGA